MRVLSQNRLFIVILLALAALPGCDLFSNDDDETPTSPLLANVALLGQATAQANAEGIAEYLGQVVNTGSVTARDVRVSVNVFDGSANLIDVASATTVPADLAVQQTATFKITTATPLAQAINFEIIIEWD